MTARMMIDRLLTIDRLEKKKGRADKVEFRCMKYTKAEFSEKLGITPRELEKLNLPYFYNSMVNKISPPLIALYCLTKFVSGEYKREK